MDSCGTCQIPAQFQNYGNNCCHQCPMEPQPSPVICGYPVPGPCLRNNVDCTLDCSPVDTSELNFIKPDVSKYGLLRHTLDQMRCLTKAMEFKAADAIAKAECVRYEGKSFFEGINSKPLEMQRMSTDQLCRRSKEVYYFWKEVERSIVELREETRLLNEVRIRVENSVRATADLILHIVNECLRRRLSRLGVDLTRDEVEEELQKERDVVLMAQRRLQEMLDQVREQIGKNRAAKERLERDWSDKLQTFRIDDCNAKLQPNNPTLMTHPGVARFQEGMLTSCEWETFTRRNLDDAEKERCASCQLRQLVPDLLKSLACHLRAQADNTEAALAKRIKETEAQKARLEQLLRLVLEEVVKAEKGVEEVRNAQKSTVVGSCLRLATQRLYNRAHRPNAELVKDCAQYSLIDEVRELNKTFAGSDAHSQNTEDVLAKLHQIRLDIEKEIATKDNTLVIDRERCQYIRAFFPSVITLIGH